MSDDVQTNGILLLNVTARHFVENTRECLSVIFIPFVCTSAADTHAISAHISTIYCDAPINNVSSTPKMLVMIIEYGRE